MEEVPTNEKPVKPWRKILFEKQPYPDNYVDPDRFLDQLDMTADGIKPTLSGMFVDTSLVAQQITAVAIFIAIHKFVLKHESLVWRLYAFDAALLLLIYFINYALSEKQPLLYHTIKMSLLFLIFLRVIAPALQTLTSSYSDDTIDALVIIFSTLHLVFHDYAYVNHSKDSFSG